MPATKPAHHLTRQPALRRHNPGLGISRRPPGPRAQRTGRPEGVRERLRRDRTAAEAEGEPGEVLDPARRAGDVAGVRVRSHRPAGHNPGRLQGDWQRLKDRLRTLTERSWSVSMDYRIGKLNRLITGWMAYFRLAQRVSVLRKLDGGCAAACGRSAGRNGRPPPPSGTTCDYEASPKARPAEASPGDTGEPQAPRSSRYPCPTPTGTTSA